MSIPDPDSDLLKKLDRRERSAEYQAIAMAAGGGLAMALGGYEILTRGFGSNPQVARDAAVLIFLAIAVSLYLKLNRRA